ncbi:site-2 protease family protein [Candidatus Parcubacteria bacterium]|nr:site-2 protease family protein [Candidatus Parcubacteria bacterium]
MTILLFLIILSVLVIVHELGHFVVAKRLGVKVEEFGVGFPPRAKKLFRWKDTDFTLNWLPFGGFVRMEEEGERKPFVLLAGVLANFALAWLLFSIMLMHGIESGGSFVQHGFFAGIWHGLLTTGKITWLTITSIFSSEVKDVVGPVGLVSIVGMAKSLGLSYILYFAALISVNLAIINLIPIPALDGGRLLIVIVERLRKRRLSKELFNKLNLVSFALLIILMVLITVRDIAHLV